MVRLFFVSFCFLLFVFFFVLFCSFVSDIGCQWLFLCLFWLWFVFCMFQVFLVVLLCVPFFCRFVLPSSDVWLLLSLLLVKRCCDHVLGFCFFLQRWQFLLLVISCLICFFQLYFDSCCCDLFCCLAHLKFSAFGILKGIAISCNKMILSDLVKDVQSTQCFSCIDYVAHINKLISIYQCSSKTYSWSIACWCILHPCHPLSSMQNHFYVIAWIKHVWTCLNSKKRGPRGSIAVGSSSEIKLSAFKLKEFPEARHDNFSFIRESRNQRAPRRYLVDFSPSGSLQLMIGLNALEMLHMCCPLSTKHQFLVTLQTYVKRLSQRIHIESLNTVTPTKNNINSDRKKGGTSS